MWLLRSIQCILCIPVPDRACWSPPSMPVAAGGRRKVGCMRHSCRLSSGGSSPSIAAAMAMMLRLMWLSWYQLILVLNCRVMPGHELIALRAYMCRCSALLPISVMYIFDLCPFIIHIYTFTTYFSIAILFYQASDMMSN